MAAVEEQQQEEAVAVVDELNDSARGSNGCGASGGSGGGWGGNGRAVATANAIAVSNTSKLSPSIVQNRQGERNNICERPAASKNIDKDPWPA